MAPGHHRRVRLRDLRIVGEHVPDIDAYVSSALTRLGVDGVLGYDFFEHFAAVHWCPHRRQIVLGRRQ